MSRLAAFALSALLAAPGCDGGGGSREVKPFLVTFVPGTEEVVSVNLRRASDVYVEDRATVGAGFDGLEAAPPRDDGLAFDRETGTIVVVDLSSLSRLSLGAVVPAAVPFAPEGAIAPPAGSFFLVHDADLARLAAVDALDPRSPAVGAETNLLGGASLAAPDPLGALVLLVPRDEPGFVAVFDFGGAASPLRLDALPIEGVLEGLAFAPYSDDIAIGIDSAGAGVVTLEISGARAGGAVAAGLLTLPDGDVPAAFASFHASPAFVVAGESGTVYRVDAADPLAPIVVGAFEGGVAEEAPELDVAPDDSLVSIAGPTGGSLRFFLLDGSGPPSLAGTFELGTTIGEAGFSTGGSASAWSARRLFHVATGGDALSLVDLSLELGGATLSPAIAFSTLRNPVLYDTKRGAVLLGLDSSGRVIRYGLYDARGAEAITSEDLGFGSATSAVFLYFRKS